MKKILLVSLFTFSFFLFTSLCEAQFSTYHPFPDSNAAWSETGWWQANCTNTQYTVAYKEYDYYVRGDTVVNGKRYIKLNMSGGYEYADPYCAPDTAWQCYNSLFCLLRNDTLARKVYASFKPNLGIIDTLLYDFNLKIGDTLPDSYIEWGSDNDYVVAIDSILVGTTYRKQFIIANDTGSHRQIFDSIIEGIGSWIGLMEYMVPPFEAGNNLNCFVDSTMVFPAGGCTIFYTCPESAIPSIKKPVENISVYPNPSSGVFTASISHSELVSGYQRMEVFNVLGQSVYDEVLKQVQHDYELDLRNNPNGIYLYRVTDKDGNLIGTGKLIITK
jgi:hypothetical protein